MESKTIFIVRPFGNKRPIIKKDAQGNPQIDFFDFDRVEKDLIIPAMTATKLDGGTTQRIFEPGEIKEDMFSQLLLADIVIADITIHNANVFYELGIRHALRQKITVLIKCSGYDDTPFDIIGYKYINYEKDNPAGVLNELIETLKNAPLSTKKDSPVFNMLPKLEEQDTEKFLAVPADFATELRIAATTGRTGKLSLLAAEIADFDWRIHATRMLGDALFKLKAFGPARDAYETIKNRYPDDENANEMLATIYQRLAENMLEQNAVGAAELIAQSDIAIDKMIAGDGAGDKEALAEAYALKARNAKTKWINSWKKLPETERSPTALQSSFLEDAYESYTKGYYENLNHYYSGINALGLLTTMVSLAETNPEKWAEPFDTDANAAAKLAELKLQVQKLSVSVQFSIEAEKASLAAKGTNDIWLDLTEADFICLTSNKPARVSAIYKKALTDAGDFHKESVLKQLLLYRQLNIMPANVSAALAIDALQGLTVSKEKKQQHTILFTGHMIDQPDRAQPRFPVSLEAAVRDKIKNQLQAILNTMKDADIAGIAGGACGGDILFHEVCAELGIKTELYLALPPDKFKTASVSFAGPGWISRFDALSQKLTTYQLSQTEELPAWLQKKKDYTIWQRNNLWLLYNALLNGGANMTLLALYDGKDGDDFGGTADMVAEATSKGARVYNVW